MNSPTVSRSMGATRALVSVILLASAFIFSACGGGGGGGSVGTPPQATAPTISTQPQNVSVTVGQSATFSVTASGSAPLSYQWQLGGTAISGATSSSYSIQAVTAQNNGQAYSVVVSNSAGSVTSMSASLSVTEATGTVAVSETSGGQQITTGGAFVLIDGVVAGQLGANGTASLTTSAGSHMVTVLDSGARGDVSVTVTANQSSSVPVAVSETDAAFVPGTSASPQIIGGIFDTTDSSKNPATISVTDSTGKAIALSTLTATLQGANLAPVDISKNVKITSSAATVDLDAAISTLGSGSIAAASADSPLLLQFEASDSSGAPYGGSLAFEVGVYTISGQVQAPASNTSLSIGGMTLTFKKHSSSATATAVSQTSGAFTTSAVPPGTYDVSGSVKSAGIAYNVFGSVVVSSNTTLTVTPLSPSDIAKGGAPIKVSTAGGPRVAISAAERAKRVAAAQAAIVRRQQFSLRQKAQAAPTMPTSGPYGNSITVSAAAEDAPVTQSATFTIPASTTSVDVIYQVCSEEYPVYVDAQSQYNDLWSVNAVDANGNVLVNDSHSVNEQLTSSPVWQADGCTSVIDTPVTVTGGTSVSLTISATNIGDDQLATTVTAIVYSSGGFSISSFALDPWSTVSGSGCTSSAPSSNTSNIVVCSSANAGDYIGIPAVTKSNTFARPATATLQNPGGSLPTVTNVELDLVDLSGNKLDTLINEAPGNTVKQASNGNLSFPITYTAGKASAVGQPPDRVSYLLTVTGTSSSGNTSTATQNLTVFNTLVEATDNNVTVGRYGARDLGGDDWTTPEGVTWLTANAALLTRFDDISGEHGRNLGHRTHGRGTEVDIFQFVSLNAATGLLNYYALRDAAVKAIGGDAAATATVANWATANRAGMDALMANGNVAFLYSGVGSCYGPLSAGWLQSLMLSGSLLGIKGSASACATVGPPQAFDMGVGTWSPAKSVTFNSVHNSHIHVALSL